MKIITALLQLTTFCFISAGLQVAQAYEIDIDGDGLPNSFELLYGLSIYVDDALLDSDGDGFSNLEEYLAASNPLAAESNPDDAAIDLSESFEEDLSGIWLNEDGWQPTSEYSTDQSSSIRSAAIDHRESTSIEWQGQTRNGRLSFDVRVDSERSFDFFEFYHNGVRTQLRLSGLRDWATMELDVDAGFNEFRWDYRKDEIVSDGEDAVWIDNVVLTRTDTDIDLDGLGAAQEQALGTDPFAADSDGDLISDGYEVDNGLDPLNLEDANTDLDLDGYTNLEEFQGGSRADDFTSIPGVYQSFENGLSSQWSSPAADVANWEVTSTTASDLSYSARSAVIADGEQSVMEWSGVTGSGTLSFDLKLDSEANYDFFQFYIDGREQVAATLAGAVGWTRLQFDIDQGSHSFRWSYTKDASFSAGDDAAWVDRIVIPAISNPVSVHLVPDLDMDGKSDIAQFEYFNGSKPRLNIRSTQNKGALRTFTWPDLLLRPELHLLQTLDGQGPASAAVYGINKVTRKPQLIVKDWSNPQFASVKFNWPSSLASPEFVALDDKNDDGVPEVAVFGINSATARPQLLVRDGANPDVMLLSYNWPALWSNARFYQLADSNNDGVKEVAIFAAHAESGRWQLLVKDGKDPSLAMQKYTWPDKWRDTQLVLPGDVSGDGVADVGLFGVNEASGRTQLVIKSGADPEAIVRIYNWPSGLQQPRYLPIPDREGDGIAEIGVYGISTDDGRLQLFIKSSQNLTTLAAMQWDLPLVDWSLVVTEDLTRDGTADIALLGDNSSSGFAHVLTFDGLSGAHLQTLKWPGYEAKSSTLLLLDDLTSDGVGEFGLYRYGGIVEIRNPLDASQQRLREIDW